MLSDVTRPEHRLPYVIVEGMTLSSDSFYCCQAELDIGTSMKERTLPRSQVELESISLVAKSDELWKSQAQERLENSRRNTSACDEQWKLAKTVLNSHRIAVAGPEECELAKTIPNSQRNAAAGDEECELAKISPSLIPGLPLDLAKRCFARVPWSFMAKLMIVCKTWAAFFTSDNIFAIRSRERLSETLLVVLSVPLSAAPMTLNVFDAKAVVELEWHKPLAVFNYVERESHHLRGTRSVVIGCNLFVIGGGGRAQPDVGTEVWRLHFGTRKWTKVAPMHVGRRDFACALINAKIYVAGGQICGPVLPDVALRSAEMYDYEHDEWHVLPQMEKERAGCLGVALNGNFCVIGGGTYGDVELRLSRSAEVLDTSNLQWKTIKNMWRHYLKLPRAVTSFGNCLFAVEGHKQTLKSYDQKTNRWRDVMPLPFLLRFMPRRSKRKHACLQQGMGARPGRDLLVGLPGKGLIWMEAYCPVSGGHRLLRLGESGHTPGSWSGTVAVNIKTPSTSVENGLAYIAVSSSVVHI